MPATKPKPTVSIAQERVLKTVIPQSDPGEVPPWRRGPFLGIVADRLKEALWSLLTPTGLLALGVLIAWGFGRVAWDPVVWAWGLHIGNAGVKTISQGAAAGMILRRPAPGILDEGEGS